MKTKKKNRFLTFCFSLLPGAAEMYMGFMKTGVSMMILFFAVIMLSVGMRQGVLGMLAAVVWFYGFFHANHLASLPDEEFDQVKDEYLFGMDALPGVNTVVEKYHKWVAWLLIFVGICFLWSSVTDLLRDVLPDAYDFIPIMMWRIGNYIPSLVIGAVIIFAGIKMISGKKAVIIDENEKENQEPVNNELENKEL